MEIDYQKSQYKMDLLEKALTTFTITHIAHSLNLATGTIKRWIQLKSVPTAYRFDLMRLIGEEINYADFSHKDKDQFLQIPIRQSIVLKNRRKL